MKEQRSYGLTDVLILVLFPFVGIVILITLRISRKLRTHTDQHLRFAHLQPTSEGNASKIRKINIQQEINIVPFEEALVINDVKTRRRLLLDLLKKDFYQHLPLLKKAVNNEDTETTHYAATALAEVKRKLMISLQDLSLQYEHKKRDYAFLTTYARELNLFLNSGFLDARTSTQYKQLYAEVLGHLLVIDPDQEANYIELIHTELELGRFASANDHCERYLRAFPDHEQAYVLMMKIYFMQKDYTGLQRVLERLGSASIPLTSHTMNTIRFWQKGV